MKHNNPIGVFHLLGRFKPAVILSLNGKSHGIIGEIIQFTGGSKPPATNIKSRWDYFSDLL